MVSIIIRALSILIIILSVNSCTTPQLRLPTSEFDIYSNDDLRASLKLAASQNILFSLPPTTLQATEVNEIDAKCRTVSQPIWSDRLSVVLSLFKRKPELLTKFHVIEFKQADRKGVSLQKDLIDGGVTLSLNFEKVMSMGTFGLNSALPCTGNRAEYLNRPLTKIYYDFPEIKDIEEVLVAAIEKNTVERFKFSNGFLMFLAERGVILRFDHDASLEKLPSGEYVLAEMMNRYSQEIKSLKGENHIGLWFKKINQNSEQAQLIQMFSIEKSKEPKTGVKIDSLGELHRRGSGDRDITHLYTTYNFGELGLQVTSLSELSDCLAKFTNEMGPFKFRQPADDKDRESYLYPGYDCQLPETK